MNFARPQDRNCTGPRTGFAWQDQCMLPTDKTNLKLKSIMAIKR